MRCSFLSPFAPRARFGAAAATLALLSVPAAAADAEPVYEMRIPVPGLTGATEVHVNAAVTLARKADGSWIGAGYGSALGINNAAAQTAFIALPLQL